MMVRGQTTYSAQYSVAREGAKRGIRSLRADGGCGTPDAHAVEPTGGQARLPGPMIAGTRGRSVRRIPGETP